MSRTGPPFSQHEDLLGRLAGFEGLGLAFERTAARLVIRDDRVGDDAFREAVHLLLDANLGGAAVRAFLHLAEAWPEDRGIADLAAFGRAAAEIGRNAGSESARGWLAAAPAVVRRLNDPKDLATTLMTLCHLSNRAPDAVPVLAPRIAPLLDALGAEGFAAWVSDGLHAAGRDRRKRRAWFALDDPQAQQRLGLGGRGERTRLERRLIAGLKCLWDVRAPLRPMPALAGRPVPRRASFAGGVPRLPESWPGVDGAASEDLFRAATAHIGAHLRLSTMRFPVGGLKPLQIVLVSLVEDARIEALAMAEMPGLKRLWAPWHATVPGAGVTASTLLARLARALFDPVAEDGNGWVTKGRAMFHAARERLHDPMISREIGGLLGNDLGQMRVPFDVRSHVVEPAYRDDNNGLWDYGDTDDTPPDDPALSIEAARIERRETPDGNRNETVPRRDSPQRARPSAEMSEEGSAIATYPEWDPLLGRERPDWTTIWEWPPPTRPDSVLSMSNDPGTARRLAALARNAAIGRRVRVRGLPDGETLDLDACIAAVVERRAGLAPETRVYQRVVPGPRDLAILLLLDLSTSTADLAQDGRSVLAMECETARVLADAIGESGDALAVHGFRSNGREQVGYTRLKDFDEPADAVFDARLAALVPAQSTRFGAAIRHAGAQLARRRAFRRVLLVLTDGEPSDVDVPEPASLVADARHATQGLRRLGVETFAFGVGCGPFREFGRIVGEGRILHVPRITALPGRVMQLYADLRK